jgi:hypothetical protein
MTTPKADSDRQVPYRLSDAIGRTRSRSRSSNHATGRGSMARADSKTTQLRLISVGANSLSKPLEAAGRPSCEWRPPTARPCRSVPRRGFCRHRGVQGGQHQSGRAGWALLGLRGRIARRSVASKDQYLARKYCRVRRLLVTVRHTTREGRFALLRFALEARTDKPFFGE